MVPRDAWGSRMNEMVKAVVQCECLMHSTKGDPRHAKFHVVQKVWFEVGVEFEKYILLVNLMHVANKWDFIFSPTSV